MQQYTVYLHLYSSLHVSGGISTHHQELISLYLQYLAVMVSLTLHTVFASYTVAFALQLRKKYGKPLSQGSRRVPVGTMKTECTLSR